MTKKTTFLLLLCLSTSSSFLFAQNEYDQVTDYRLQALSREQGTGNRVQVRDTNQVTGDRLQGTGTNKNTGGREQGNSNRILILEDQIGQRAKITTNYNNQATGYRLQATDRRKAELGSEDYIDQQVNITANCQMRTANCDNSGIDLNYHLMMNPSSIENGVERLPLPFGMRPSAQGEVGAVRVVANQGDSVEATIRSKNAQYAVDEAAFVGARANAVEGIELRGVANPGERVNLQAAEEGNVIRSLDPIKSKKLDYAEIVYKQAANAYAAGRISLSKIWNDAADEIKTKALLPTEEIEEARNAEAALEQDEQVASAKASFAEAKREWLPVSQAIQNYLDNPHAEASTVFDAEALLAGDTLHKIQGPDGKSAGKVSCAGKCIINSGLSNMSMRDMSAITRTFIRDKATLGVILGTAGIFTLALAYDSVTYYNNYYNNYYSYDDPVGMAECIQTTTFGGSCPVSGLGCGINGGTCFGIDGNGCIDPCAQISTGNNCGIYCWQQVPTKQVFSFSGGDDYTSSEAFDYGATVGSMLSWTIAPIIPVFIAMCTTACTVGDVLAATLKKYCVNISIPSRNSFAIAREDASDTTSSARKAMAMAHAGISKMAALCVSPLVVYYGAYNAPFLSAYGAARSARNALLAPCAAVGGLTYGGLISSYVGAYTAGDFLGFTKSNTTHSATEAALALARAYNHSFSQRRVPSGAILIAVTDAAAQAAIAAAQAVGTDWEEEANWAAQSAQEIAAFNQALATRNLWEESPAQEKREKTTAALFETSFAESIAEAKVQAEEAAGIATAAKEQAEQQGTSEKKWRVALEEATLAEEAYAHLAGLYKTYQKQVAGYYEAAMVTIKRSRYNLELQRAETKRATWASEVEECQQKKGMTETSSLL